MALSNCRECGKSVSTLAKTCPHCGVPKPVKKIKKVSKKTKPNKKNKDKIWVHCRDYKCKDYTQMYQIYKDYLDLDSTGYIINIPGTSKTNIEGVFVSGDAADHVYRQAITAAGTGCMAALDAERFLASKE